MFQLPKEFGTGLMLWFRERVCAYRTTQTE